MARARRIATERAYNQVASRGGEKGKRDLLIDWDWQAGLLTKEQIGKLLLRREPQCQAGVNRAAKSARAMGQVEKA